MYPGRRAVFVLTFLIVGFAWQAFGNVTTCFGPGNCIVSTLDAHLNE